MRKSNDKPRGRTRCAIYTRKSSEDGLEQDFNSLDAQREACVAFIASQRHEGWVCLPQMYDDGGISGATLYRLLQNRLYRGEVVHKGASHPGEHAAIVDPALWEEVQRTLADNRTGHVVQADAAEASLLAGLLHDHTGEPMTPSHASKRGRRYRYYVSRSLIGDRRAASPQGRRVPAGDIEAAVEERVCRFLADGGAVFDAMDSIVADLSIRSRIVTEAAALAAGGRARPWGDRHRLLQALIGRVDLGAAELAIHLRPAQLPLLIGEAPADETPVILLRVACELRRAGLEMRLLLEGSEPRRAPDHHLQRLLGQAHRFRAMVLRGDGRSIGELAAAAGVSPSWFTRILRLSFLAPDIVSAILDDRHPIGLSAHRLARLADLPIAWTDQRHRLGLR